MKDNCVILLMRVILLAQGDHTKMHLMHKTSSYFKISSNHDPLKSATFVKVIACYKNLQSSFNLKRHGHILVPIDCVYSLPIIHLVGHYL